MSTCEQICRGNRNLFRKIAPILLAVVVGLGCSIAFQPALAGASSPTASPKAAVYGAEANPTGDPIGGGAGYSRIVTSGDYIVASKAELLAALQRAKAGKVVYVAPDAEIDLTGEQKITIPPGVTLAGNRGQNGAPGPLIFSNELNTYPLFTAGSGVRVTGLRLRGPDPETRESAYVLPNSMAIQSNGDHLEVDNNEIFNWSYAGVAVSSGNAHVHHNNIHHVRRSGLGYPVVVNQGTALIEANHFDWYRHAIASTGYPGVGYEARYNIVGPNATSFAFDMHGGADFCPKRSTPCTEEESYMGGEWIRIHHNTFYVTSQRGIGIRGVPLQGAEIYRNWFLNENPDMGVGLYYRMGNVDIYDNVHGPKQTLVERYLERSPLVQQCPSLCNLKTKRPIIAVVEPLQVKIKQPAAARGAFQAQGLMPVDVAVNLGDVLEVRTVEIRLDDQILFSQNRPPATGELVVDTLAFADGHYTLTLSVLTDTGDKLTHSVPVRIYNWWRAEDPLEPPITSGWFGPLRRSLTVEESAGWQFADPEAPAPFGDAGRMTRLEQTEEYLVWEAERLRLFWATLYVKGELGDNWVYLATSPDGTTWTPLTYTAHVEGTDGEWALVRLTGEVPNPSEVRRFRLLVSGAAPPNAVQVGEMILQGLRPESGQP